MPSLASPHPPASPQDGASAEAKRLRRELDSLLYLVGHDLQEPVRKLASFSDLLRLDLQAGDLAAAQTDAGFISAAARRLGLQLDGLCRLSRLTREPPSPRDIDPAQRLQRVLSELSEQVETSAAEIVIGALPASVHMDPGDLHGVLREVIRNAMVFRREGIAPRIEITWDAAGLRVRDHGIGIPGSAWGDVFLPLWRGHGHAEFPGVGMGLAVARRLVERNGGSIRVAPTDGPGATVRVDLAPT